MTDDFKIGIDANDFMIRVSPQINDEGYWDGSIELAVVTQPGNDLDDEDYFSMLHMCKMMAATIPIMEVNEDLRDLVHNYVEETIDKQYEVELEEKPKVVKQEDNVLTIDFNTSTKGSA